MSRTYRGFTFEQIAGAIDHSVLKPNNTQQEIIDACKVAAKFQTASLCIRPMDVALAAKELAGSGVPVCTVIGFPHGTTTTATKVFESVEAIANGATELDMVLNVSQLVDGYYEEVERDIASVVAAAEAQAENVIVKVIFETALLTSDQIVKACQLTEAAGADFVKTSTGFASAGATVEHIRLMKATVGDRLQVKSSGGVRTLDQLIDMLEAGADRSGCSATEAVLAEFEEKAL
jgi:deoxyribose-phosphate aldolase